MTISVRTPARLAVVATSLLTLVACGGDPSGQPADVVATHGGTSSTPATPTTSSSTPPGEQPELIAYAGGEAVPPLIEDTADAEQDLPGAPAAFVTFIGKTAEQVGSTADCDGAAVGVTVDAIRTDGFAVGAVNECGGYAAMWAEVDGAWQQIDGTQDTWDCAILERYEVPSDLLLGRKTCFDYDGDGKAHRYHHA